MELVFSLLFLIPASALAVGALALALIGRIPRRAFQPSKYYRIAVLIPAHDEELSLPTTLASVFLANTNADVFVVADNCTDGTVRVAERHGAKVLVRIDPTRIGKGYALEFGLAQLSAFDAVFVLDADCRVEPNLFAELNAILECGAEAAQTRVISNPSLGAASYVAAVGAQIDDALACGKDRLGLSTALRGTGMLFTTKLLKRNPWHCCGLAEDAEYASVLQGTGIRVRFIESTAVYCEAPSELGEFLNQRKRWGAALAIRDSQSVLAPLKSKPLVLAHLVLTTLLAPIAWPLDLAAIWLAAIWFFTLALYGWAMSPLPLPRSKSLVHSFAVVARLGVQALFGFRSPPVRWLRTARKS